MNNPFSKYSDRDLVSMSKEFKAYEIAEDSELRKIAKQLHGRDDAMSIVMVQDPFIEEIVKRLEIYSPHIKLEL